jgi:leucine dehydrogenase
MKLFETFDSMGHEQVVFCNTPSAGLKAIIAIHDTTLGPALGGCRLWDYPSEEDALRDVLRLSRGMTYKAAVAGLDLGGGKAVIIRSFGPLGGMSRASGAGTSPPKI